MKSIRHYDNAADAGYAESVLSAEGITAIVADEIGGPHPGFHLRVDEADKDRALSLLGDDGGTPVTAEESIEPAVPAPAIRAVPFFASCRQCGSRWELTTAESSGRSFTCPDCGTTFPIFNLDAIPDIWESGLAFPQPKWKTVTQVIRQSYTPEEQPELWTQAALQWVRNIRAVAGEQYRIYQSKHFVILTVRDKEAAKGALSVCESALAAVRALLGSIAWHWTEGKHVTLLFDSEAAYYRYYSCFLKDDTQVARSGGVFLNRGYCHTSIPPIDNALGRGYSSTPVPPSQLLATVLAHEYTHLSLVKFKLPRWLEEGLAVNAENRATGRRGIRWDDRLADSHMEKWNENTIQQFWTGKSFKDTDLQRVSYSLAEILVSNMLADFGTKMINLIHDANWNDAGEASTLTHLGIGLEDIAAKFLGPGDWKPRPEKNQ